MRKKRLKIVVFSGTLLIIYFLLNYFLFSQSSCLAEPVFEIKHKKENSLPLTFQKNTLLPLTSPPRFKVVKTFKVIVTAYSSTYFETDETPFITASGKKVREGVVANNLLPLGTKIKLPELFGEKIFVVEDRMNPKKSLYHIDIWFPSYWEAKQFGVKKTFVEVLED